MDYNINKTRFNFNLRNALKPLNEAKNIAKNENELFEYLKDINDIIEKIETLVNKKVKFDINLE